MLKISSLLLVLTLGVATAFAQKEGPRVSPKATSKNGNVSVSYSQPSKKGRVIFGELVPYGQVWRTGANEATEITFKKDGMFGGNAVKKGTYTLFTIPRQDSWEIILNSELKQWGAFGYDKIKGKDVLHVNVATTKVSDPMEKFTITVKANSVDMQWDQTMVSVPTKF